MDGSIRLIEDRNRPTGLNLVDDVDDDDDDYDEKYL
jgi:hypothetical protein